MVVEKNYDSLPDQGPVKIDNELGPGYDVETEWDASGIARTDDVGVSLVAGDPGDVIDWHTHAPDFYQLLVCITGTNRWYYLDAEETEQHIDVEAGETLFLPGGITNKEEVIGDERHAHITITPRVWMDRWEYFDPDEYPRDYFAGAFEYDSFNDTVLSIDDEAIIENRREDADD